MSVLDFLPSLVFVILCIVAGMYGLHSGRRRRKRKIQEESEKVDFLM